MFWSDGEREVAEDAVTSIGRHRHRVAVELSLREVDGGVRWR